MGKVVFDTSVWINFSKGVDNRATRKLEEYLYYQSHDILMIPTVVQEFLMGVRTPADFKKYNLYFSKLPFCEDDWFITSVAAAKLHFDLKKKGVTIRQSTDCMIAQVAIQNNALLVHNDSDFELIAKGSELKTFK
jgi:hypothetical protein